MELRNKAELIIDSEIAALPIGHLYLGLRARRVTASFKSIGSLHAAWANPRGGLGTPSVVHELDCVFGSLLSITERRGVEDWDAFRRSRRLPKDNASQFSIYFMSPSLHRLKRTVTRHQLAQLHLSIRSINALEAIGVTTIGGLVEKTHAGLPRLRAAGYLSASEIRAALEALAAVITPDGDVNWIRYAWSCRMCNHSSPR